jgi:hypothetical protein
VLANPTTKSLCSTPNLQYRVQFLDGSARVIREMFADARNDVGAIALVVDVVWPPRAVTMRVLDLDGREVHSAIRGEFRK